MNERLLALKLSKLFKKIYVVVQILIRLTFFCAGGAAFHLRKNNGVAAKGIRPFLLQPH